MGEKGILKFMKYSPQNVENGKNRKLQQAGKDAQELVPWYIAV